MLSVSECTGLRIFGTYERGAVPFRLYEISSRIIEHNALAPRIFLVKLVEASRPDVCFGV